MATTRLHGPAVRAIREAKGLRHGVFAVNCDITPGYLTKIEQGLQQPRSNVVAAMANALGVPRAAIEYSIPDCDECPKAKPGTAA